MRRSSSKSSQDNIKYANALNKLLKWVLDAYAVKSAEPDAARKAFVSKQQLHTAPLCPSNVPIQSPVSPFLSMGLESEHRIPNKEQCNIIQQ